MGVNLIPIIRNFTITNDSFDGEDPSVKEGCVKAGDRKLLRFDFLCWNAGDIALVIGDPHNNPQWFEYSPAHGHFHLKNFNVYALYDYTGKKKVSDKQTFCIMDSEPMNTTTTVPLFDHNCNSNQGLSAGWADVYENTLPCQWIDITEVPDGDYLLEAITNSNYLFKEDRYGDNIIWKGLIIAGNTVTEIPPPFYFEDTYAINPFNILVEEHNNKWWITNGQFWILNFGTSESKAKKAKAIIEHYRLDEIGYVGRPSKNTKELMMYFKTGGNAPQGVFEGEHVIDFNLDNVVAQKNGYKWKVVSGNTVLIDFGFSEANAKKSVFLIKKYGFNQQCFIGSATNWQMMYFRR